MFEIHKKTSNLKIQNSQNPKFSGSQQLFDSEVGLIRYTSEIVHKFYKLLNLEKRIKEDNENLLEFGAGTGFLAQLFKVKFGIRPDCVELDPVLANLVRDKGFSCYRFLKDSKRVYSAIYTSNVLEHIQDDSEILIELYGKLSPGGLIGIYVPAHQFLFSTMDEQIGHVRRYSKRGLLTKINNAGFQVKLVQYDDFLGFFASLAVKTIGYKNKAKLGSARSLIVYDRFVYPVSQVLDRLGFKHLIGKNLLVIAEKEHSSVGEV